MATSGRRGLRRLAAGFAAVIRVDQWWLATEPVDMRTGADRLLAQVIQMLGAAQPHHAWLFANRRGNRLKVMVHDGHGIWLAQRRLHQGRFHWQNGEAAVTLTRQQFDALVLGLSWQQLSDGGVIRLV